jgi:hypothetical protein
MGATSDIVMCFSSCSFVDSTSIFSSVLSPFSSCFTTPFDAPSSGLIAIVGAASSGFDFVVVVPVVVDDVAPQPSSALTNFGGLLSE